MHSAPWTNTSVSTPACSVIRRTSSRVHSRLSTTRENPMSRASRAPSSVWMVICVEACSAKSGACAWISRASPRS